MLSSLHSLKAVVRFRDYRPLRMTFSRTKKWIEQFDKKDREVAAFLLNKIIYLSEGDTERILLQQNESLVRRLTAAGVARSKLIYVQVHDPGSSSPVMLNLLRDAARLERSGCHMIDGRDSLGLNRLTNELGEGALVYVDDFLGTGNQFCKERDFVIKSAVGPFSEFLLVPCICEEAIYQIAARGIEAFAGHVHSKVERPLHDNSHLLDQETKQRMRDLCRGISPKMGLGYKELATMVVLYRNAPNSIPAIFRGSVNQAPFLGLFPRSTDLPPRQP